MGYKVIPINPGLAKQGSILHGEKVYEDLESVALEYSVDMVDIFRRSQDAGQFVGKLKTLLRTQLTYDVV